MMLLDLRQVQKTFPVKLRKGFGVEHKQVHAVDDVSFAIRAGETFGIVGESGSGKSTLARLIMGLEQPTAGVVRYRGRDVATGRQTPATYWKEVQMIFQDPFSSLNPRMRIGRILAEPLRNFADADLGSIDEQVERCLDLVGLPTSAMARYPHELSGGQRQRVAIAAALAANPRVVVADEPVSALDVSVQAQIINLLSRLRSQLGLTYVFITHDLNLSAYFCDRIVVLYLGQIMEICEADTLLRAPLHPYTRALISAVPAIDPGQRLSRVKLTGEIPSPLDPPGGCPFHPRCPLAIDRCRQVRPTLETVEGEHRVACHVVAPSKGKPS